MADQEKDYARERETEKVDTLSFSLETGSSSLICRFSR